MSNGLNTIELNQYATRFSTLVLNQAYRSQNILNGHNLLKISPVKQVNLGILNRLFETWKSNAESFKSVYFDFGDENVKSALVTFMNTVSQHIAVRRTDLEPLLEDATREALELLLVPKKYFTDKINASDGFSYDSAEQLFKYTHINKKVAEKLAQDLAASGETSVKSSVALGWLNDALLKIDSKEALEGYTKQFGEILAFNSEKLLTVTGITAPAIKSTVMPEEESFFDIALKDSESIKPQSIDPIKAESSVSLLSEIVSKSTPPENNSLNSSFKVDIPKPSETNTYGSVPVKVETISGAIPLGQRFMFVNQLFSRNNEHFEKAIYELDAVKSYEEAKDLIWHRYASKYAWDVNGEAVTTLLSIVKRKFS
tara:strand:+ start:281 stop:1393 length:1113 start_codon:yes stop_codon:yes gene_type:complete